MNIKILCELFLRFDREFKKEIERLICYASDRQLKLLSESERWHLDGTIRVATGLFYLIYYKKKKFRAKSYFSYYSRNDYTPP